MQWRHSVASHNFVNNQQVLIRRLEKEKVYEHDMADLCRMPLIFLQGELLGSLQELREALQSGLLEQKFTMIGVKRRKS